MATTTITFNKADLIRTLKCLVQFSAKQDVRYYLKGVHFKTNGDQVALAATNGNYLCDVVLSTVEQVQAECEFVIERDSIEQLLKVLRPARLGSKAEESERIILEVVRDDSPADGSARTSVTAVDCQTGARTPLAVVPCNYPDYQRIYTPLREAVEGWGIGIDLAAAMFKALGAFQHKGAEGALIEFTGPNTVAIITLPGPLSAGTVVSVRAGIMPCRV